MGRNKRIAVVCHIQSFGVFCGYPEKLCLTLPVGCSQNCGPFSEYTDYIAAPSIKGYPKRSDNFGSEFQIAPN